MTWEILLVLILLLAALASFVLERVPPDLTALGVFAVLLVLSVIGIEGDLPETHQLLSVLSNPAPLTIAAMFILSAALERTGGIDIIARQLQSLTKLGPRRFMFLMMLLVAVVSAFVNNTPVVMVFMPVVLGLSRSLNQPASKLLIPLSFASIFGGACTVVGTSTNILATSILFENGQEPLRMFELGKVGLPLLGAGILYLTFLGPKILPRRETLTAILSEEERKEYIAEAFVQVDSPSVGKTPFEAGLTSAKGVRILELIRDNVALKFSQKETTLEAGDRMVLACRPSGFAHTRSISGVDLTTEMGIPLETISAQEGSLVEGVIGPRSTLVGKTIREINFRQRFRVIVMAIHRQGVNVREKVDTLPLAFGDTLLMMGTDHAIEELHTSDDVMLLDRPPTPAVSRRKKLPIVLTILVLVIGVAAVGLAPITVLAVAGAFVAFVTGCISPKEGYASIDWPILILIYGMLALGQAMDQTGAAALIAHNLMAVAMAMGSEALMPFLLLGAIYITTAVFTEALSNNAAVVLMAPIAISLAQGAGLDVRPFVVATAIAASASFSTPIGYQTNTYVYGVGGYKFTDFTKIGLPLNFCYFVGSMIIIPLVWKF